MFSSVCFKIKLQSQHLVDLLIPKYLCRRVLFLRLLFHLVVRFSTVGRSLCYCCLLPSFISLAEKKKKKSIYDFISCVNTFPSIYFFSSHTNAMVLVYWNICFVVVEHSLCLYMLRSQNSDGVVHSTHLSDRTSDTQETQTHSTIDVVKLFCRVVVVVSLISSLFHRFSLCTNRSRRMHVNECVVILLIVFFLCVHLCYPFHSHTHTSRLSPTLRLCSYEMITFRLRWCACRFHVSLIHSTL